MNVDATVNELEICVVALRRSGHHAIVQWLLRHLRGHGCFLNDCRPGVSPFASGRRDNSIVDGIDVRLERQGCFTRKDYLVYNYENHELTDVFASAAVLARDAHVGRSRRRVTLLVLRDPFNNLASLVRWSQGRRFAPTADDVRRCAQLWKAHAREYVGRSRVIPGERLVVSFNEWFLSREYRRGLAAALGLAFTDRGLNDVARWGPSTWGDSFDGLGYDGRAQQMKVLERYRRYCEDERYLRLFDAEMIALSERIYGRIEGTEAIVGQAV